MSYPVLFTTVRGIEAIAAQELQQLGLRIASQASERKGWVRGTIGSLVELARLCYTARTIQRGVWVLAEGTIRRTMEGLQDIYDLVKGIEWQEWLLPETAFCVRSNRHGRHLFQSPDIERTSGQAIVDKIRERTGHRQPVRLDQPDVLVRVEVTGEHCVVGIDFVGEEALHRRGYRVYDHPAALNPVLAAAMVLLAQWQPHESLLDPMCGSGTVLVEAALLARSVPAGFFRKNQFLFRSLPFFAKTDFDELLLEWDMRADWNLRVPLFGADVSPKHIVGAQQNADRALVADTIAWGVSNLADLPQKFPPKTFQCLITNPPFGVRLGSPARARETHRTLLQVADELLSDNGRLVVITHHPEWVETIAPYLGFSLQHRCEVLHGDLPATIAVFSRSKLSTPAGPMEVHSS